MAATPGFGDALAEAIRGAAGGRVRIRDVTTCQAALGHGHAVAATAAALTATAHLTAAGPDGSTRRFLMVGKDRLDDAETVLG